MRALVVLIVCLVIQPALAFEWVPGANYDPSVPTLDEFLGRTFAERHSSVDEILAYCELLASRSDRVAVNEIGSSVEGDPLVLLTITSPANAERHASRASHLETVLDPWRFGSTERADATRELLPVVWIGSSVHGDEASGADAALMLAYHLAADASQETLDVLERCVVLIQPCQNPDGRRRFLNHVRSFRRQVPGPDADPAALEHHQLWPGGRRNHYLFDLNRDWAFVTQQETRAHVAAFLRVRPQVCVDLHEMGRESSYFFPPPTDPVNPNVPPELREWWDVFGRANAMEFDRRGFDYFVRESFDLFYPGYGDSWPTLQGAVGMTYEQATTRGLALRRDSGQVLYYRQAVLRHFVAALTTCRTAARNDRELVESFANYFDLAKKAAAEDAHAELVLLADDRPQQAHSLALKLVRQGIRVRRSTEATRAKLQPYGGGDDVEREIPAGSILVSSAQPGYSLLKSLLDPHTPMDEHFLQQERERKARGLHDRFYDVTAWSLVLSHGLRAYHSRRRIDVAAEPVRADDVLEGWIENATSVPQYGYVIPYEDNAALAAMCRLLWSDVRISLAREDFNQHGRQYPAGTLVVKLRENEHIDDLPTLMSEIVRQTGARVYQAQGAWTDSGPTLGGGGMMALRRPEIAVVSGPAVSPASLGALRFILERRYEIPHTLVLPETVSDARLRDFDVLVVPDIPGELDLDTEVLDRWIRAGGNLVTIGGAAAWAAGLEEQEWTTVEVVKDLDAVGTRDDQGDPAYAEDEEDPYIPPERRPDRTPGAILRLTVDTRHPVAIAEGRELVTPVLSDRLLRLSSEGDNIARYAETDARMAGFMWPAMEDAIRGLAYLVQERHGAGTVVLFSEDPSFRASWEGLDRLLLHAILLPSSMQK